MKKAGWYTRPWMIFWVAFALRVVVIVVGHQYRIRTDQANFNFGFEAGRIARSLAWGQGYANSFNGVSGPTAWLPPLYPLLLGGVFKLFGVYTRTSGFVILALNSVFSAAVVPAVYEIGARVFDVRGIARRGAKVAAPVGMWAAWVWAVYPAALQYAVHWVWEMSLTACLFAWVMVVALRLRERRGLRRWFVFGGLWGLIALSNASLLLCFPAMVVWIVWPESREQRLGTRDWRASLVGVLVACLVFGVVLLPWVWRNERVLHAFVPTRGNLGIELYESTLEGNDGLPWGTTLSLWPGDAEFRRYVSMGEVKYSAMRGAEAKRRIAAEPARFARWTVQRFCFFWDGTPHPPGRHPAQEYLRQLSYCFISVCGLLGMGLMVRRRVNGAGLFALVFVLLPLPYYLVTVQPRFRHPLEPLIAVLAVFLFRCAEKKESVISD